MRDDIEERPSAPRSLFVVILDEEIACRACTIAADTEANLRAAEVLYNLQETQKVDHDVHGLGRLAAISVRHCALAAYTITPTLGFSDTVSEVHG